MKISVKIPEKKEPKWTELWMNCYPPNIHFCEVVTQTWIDKNFIIITHFRTSTQLNLLTFCCCWRRRSFAFLRRSSRVSTRSFQRLSLIVLNVWSSASSLSASFLSRLSRLYSTSLVAVSRCCARTPICACAFCRYARSPAYLLFVDMHILQRICSHALGELEAHCH